MKQLILLACSTFILAQASAQNIGKTIFVTASGGGSYQKENQLSRSTSIQISTSINYLLQERWAVGFAAENSRAVTETGHRSVPVNNGTGYSTSYSAAETKLRTWFLGPQARYYHPFNQQAVCFQRSTGRTILSDY